MKTQTKCLLRKYAPNLITAYFYNYSVNLPKKILTDIEQIIGEETGTEVNFNLSCASCVLKMLKIAAQIYYKKCPEELPEGLKL